MSNFGTGQRAAALVEFALAWPVALLLVLGCVQLAVWSVEDYAARSAALAGARAATVAGSRTDAAVDVTIRSLQPLLVGSRASPWCPGQPGGQPQVWVCALDRGDGVQVRVGGTVPAIVPIGLGSGLPVHADVSLRKEMFQP